MAIRKLSNQSPNSYAALAAELQPGEQLVIGRQGGGTQVIKNQADLDREASTGLRHASPSQLYFGAQS